MGTGAKAEAQKRDGWRLQAAALQQGRGVAVEAVCSESAHQELCHLTFLVTAD